MSKSINPDFIETTEQREFRQAFMQRIYSVYRFDDNIGVMDIGEDKKISLQDIYVPLRFSKTELSESRDWGIEEKTLPILDVLSISKCIVLSGKPGSGKTTISKIIINMLSSKALTAFTEKCGRRIPLYFRLRDYKVKNIKSADDLLDMYIEDQSKTLGLRLNKDILEFYLKSGWCFILFDGVDEVGGIGNRLKIREMLLRKYALYNDDNYIIVTSRPSGLENLPFDKLIDEEDSSSTKLLKLFYVDSFNKSQAHEFSEKWFALREHNPSIIKNKTEEFLNSIEKIESLSALRRRPVFLAMMIHIHTTKGKLPHSRVTAYEYMVAAYIESIDITRRLHKEMYPDEKYAEWNFEDKLRLLQGIAFEFHSTRNNKNNEVQIVVTRNELINIIEKIIKEKQDNFQTLKIKDKESLLSFYLTRTGLLHEPEQDKIQFSHLSFQEYLTARYIYKEIIENFFKAPEIINEKIVSRLNSNDFTRWQEVILLFFSMNKTITDQILDLIRNNIKDDESKYYFTYTIILMFNSEEYGIKKSQEKKWINEVISNIAILNFEKEIIKEDNKNELLALFLKTQKLDVPIEYLKEIFYKYFEKIKLEECSNEDLSIFKIVLTIILYNENTANLLKYELDLAINTITSRKNKNLFFISCAEQYFDSFQELSGAISDLYDLEQKIIARDFLSSAVYKEFVNNNNRWDYKIVEYEYIIRELFLLNLLFREMEYVNKPRGSKKKAKSTNIFKDLSEQEEILWNNFWNLLLWHNGSNGYNLAKYRDFARSIIARYLSHEFNEVDDRFLEIIKYCNSDDVLKNELEIINFDKFMLTLKKVKSKLKKNNTLTYELNDLLDICKLVEITFLVVISDYKFCKTRRKINVFWKNLSQLKEFMMICMDSQKLYTYLDCKKEVDFLMFCEQYKKYFSKSYSFVNMLEEILEYGDEKILKYSHLDILKMCANFMEQLGKVLNIDT